MLIIKLFLYILTLLTPLPKTITIVQFKGVSDSVVCAVIKEEKLIYGFNVHVISNVKIPDSIYFPYYSAYTGDKMLSYLKHYAGYRVLGICSEEIINIECGHTIDLYGYGFLPPYKACVVSTYMLTKNIGKEAAINSIHELGHTFGLKHCWNTRCYMNEGDGTEDGMNLPFILCDSCRKNLKF